MKIVLSVVSIKIFLVLLTSCIIIHVKSNNGDISVRKSIKEELVENLLNPDENEVSLSSGNCESDNGEILAGCICFKDGQCESKRCSWKFRCAEKGDVGESCNIGGNDCMDELECSSLHRKCYHSPGWDGEPCGVFKDCANNLKCKDGECERTIHSNLGEHCEGDGKGCVKGLSCSNVLHQCFHYPRELHEPCGDVGVSCKDDLSCSELDHKCYHVPREEHEPCGAENSCGDGLQCNNYNSKCRKAKELNEHCVIGECDDGLTCSGKYQMCFHYPRELNEPCGDISPCVDGLTCSETDYKCIEGNTARIYFY